MDSKEDRTPAIKAFWNKFSESYEGTQERPSMQAATVLYNFCLPRKAPGSFKSRSPTKILEVGVGPGKASRMYISAFLEPGSLYFNADIAQGMIELYTKRFEESDLAFSPRIKLDNLEIIDKVDIDDLIRKGSENKIGEQVTKRIFTLVTNSEMLPFEDSCLDCYIANLSVQIVNDHKKMISEAYRVLEEGGVAGISSWGRRENTQYFDSWPKFLKEQGVELPESKHSNFDRGDKEIFEEDLKEAGFKQVKLFYTPNNKPYFDAETTFGYLSSRPDSRPYLNKLSEERNEEIKSAFIQEFNEKFGPETPDPLTFEVLIAIAWK